MSVEPKRKKEIKKCVQDTVVSPLRKRVSLKMDAGNKNSGRSGGHGKKFNIISSELIRISNNNKNALESVDCFKNEQERKIVIAELKLKSKQFQERATGVNHLNYKK